VQATAGVEPHIDMFGWVREDLRRAVHTQSVTIGTRRDGSNVTIAFLGEVDAIAADVEITLARGFSAAVLIPLAVVTPQSAISRWHLGARGGGDRGQHDGEAEGGVFHWIDRQTEVVKKY
jgi:hypothetical protein